MSAVRAPCPCSSALVATVIPCAKRRSCAGSEPAFDSTAATASSTPSASSAVVVGSLALRTSPPAVTSTASVNVPPTSTPRSTPPAYAGRAGARARPALRGGELLVLGLRQVVVRRAVAVVRERSALAGRALARGRAALRRRAADRRVALERMGLDELLGRVDVAVYALVQVGQRRHRELAADLPEQRARRPREVVAVGGKTGYHGLACA